MFDRRYAYLASAVYGAAITATLIVGATAAFIVVLRRLKPDERTALVLKAAGYSYEEIGRNRSWTYTKVNRDIAEGRQALHSRVAWRGARPFPQFVGRP